MTIINIKPISVNECWQGRRFKTKKYKSFESEALFLLPEIELPDPPYKVYYEFGLSNSLSDIDNPVKPFQDVLQKRYGFNDKDINEMTVKRNKVKKGFEFIKFNIEHYEE